MRAAVHWGRTRADAPDEAGTARRVPSGIGGIAGFGRAEGGIRMHHRPAPPRRRGRLRPLSPSSQWQPARLEPAHKRRERWQRGAKVYSGWGFGQCTSPPPQLSFSVHFVSSGGLTPGWEQLQRKSLSSHACPEQQNNCRW